LKERTKKTILLHLIGDHCIRLPEDGKAGDARPKGIITAMAGVVGSISIWN